MLMFIILCRPLFLSKIISAEDDDITYEVALRAAGCCSALAELSLSSEGVLSKISEISGQKKPALSSGL